LIDILHERHWLVYIRFGFFPAALAMASLPYTTTVASYGDIQLLERDIRVLMRCQGNTCAFLQSAEYKTLTFAMTRELAAMTREFPTLQLHIPHSNLVMHVSSGITISIQAVATAIEPEAAAEAEPRQKRQRV
jgi:hypothetical protein